MKNNGTAVAKAELKKLTDETIMDLEQIITMSGEGRDQLIREYAEAAQQARLQGQALSLYQQTKVETFVDAMAYIHRFMVDYLKQFRKNFSVYI